MVYLDEDKVRELVEEAVQTARNTTPGNVCDEAVVQWTMDDKFIDGRWRSTYFLDKELAHVPA
jgi:hypothetical protein